MTDFRALLDKGGCEDNHGCHPTICICALAGDMVDEIERLHATLAEIASQCHNLPRSATADKIEKLARSAVTMDVTSNG